MTVSGITGSGGEGRDDGDAGGTPPDDAFGQNDTSTPDSAAPKVSWRESPPLPDGPDDDAPAETTPEVAADEPEQLVLGDDEVRLPWLEAGDEDDLQERSSTGQLAGLVLLGLVALGLIVGVIWWATRKSDDAALLADGSTIEAPDTPYKEKPGDPGGKTFDGTGDTSFAVSEGQSRQVRLGQERAPQPGFASVNKDGGRPGTAVMPAVKEPTPAMTSGVGVQVGAYSTAASAETGWSTLSQRHEMLSALKHRVVEGKADIGTVYRLQAVAADAAAARALCDQLRSAGLACQVKN